MELQLPKRDARAAIKEEGDGRTRQLKDLGTLWGKNAWQVYLSTADAGPAFQHGKIIALFGWMEWDLCMWPKATAYGSGPRVLSCIAPLHVAC